jgi:tetratricopeptide (TPR) repeat protein
MNPSGNSSVPGSHSAGGNDAACIDGHDSGTAVNTLREDLLSRRRLRPLQRLPRALASAISLFVVATTVPRAPGWAAGDSSPPATGAKANVAPGKPDARAQAKEVVAKAQLDYKIGLFKEALDGYRRAYELYSAPALLFNMGQCERNLGNPERAIFLFEGYVRDEPHIDPARLKLAQELIAESRVELGRKRAAMAPSPPYAPSLTAGDTSVATPPGDRLAAGTDLRNPRALVARPGDQATARQPSILHRWWFWTLAGAAVLAGGALFYATGDPRVVPPVGSIGAANREMGIP